MKPTDTADVTLRLARFPDDLDTVRSLFLDYQTDMGIDLCFQGFEAELANLPGEYALPAGSVFVALVGGQ
ncbi:MAG: GNAT family N-acetyltransferase, partial [Hydrogenophaga sp.]|nr:GNAT family N-acetyltransferase [Hydrogenophaga sp.]